MSKCRTITYEGERIFIPGCMGAAVYGKERCTCRDGQRITFTEYDRLIKRIEKIENHLGIKNKDV